MCNNLPQANGLIGQASYTVNGANAGGVSGSTLNGPRGGAASNGTAFYLADSVNHRILGYSRVPSGTAAAAGFVIGQPDEQSNASGTAPVSGSPVKFSLPAKASIGTVGSSSYLLVADSGNNRVLIWNKLPAGNTAPDVVVGQPDLISGDANHPDGTASASSLNNPTAALITSRGQLVVVDKGNNRVLIWNAVPTANNSPANLEQGQSATDSTGKVSCTANSGPNGYCFTTNVQDVDRFNGTTYLLAMRQPSDAWTDGLNLLVSDTGNNRVLYWASAPGAMNQLPDNLLGASQFGTYTPGGGSGPQAFNAPWGVASDGANVFVADSGNNRVLEFQSYVAGPSNGPRAADVFGQQDFTHNAQNDPDQNGQVGDQRKSPATSGITAGTLFAPQGVFASGNELFVTDTSNNRVLHFAESSGVDGSQPWIPCAP